MQEAQEALWMANEGVHPKNPNQRKRRQERESCINNVKLNYNQASLQNKNYYRHQLQQQQQQHQIIDNSTYTRHHPRNRFQRGSLENVSTNPWGELRVPEQSSLRRSRSLAIARDDIFNNLEVQTYNSNRGKPRRAQLIPRAKLIERTTSREQRSTRGSSVEHLPLIKRKSSPVFPDYPSEQFENSTLRQNNNQEVIHPKFQTGQEQHDSLDSNYQNKTSLNTDFRVSYDDLPGLSLPNYYPDSKYDTDDNDVSGTDNISSESCDNSKKYSSCGNLSSTKWTSNEPESIPYDDNIVLSTNRPLYDSLKETHYAKPKTIRGPVSYQREQTFYYNEKRKSLPSTSSSDISDEKQNLEDDKISLDYFETDSNFDEIRLNNAQKIVEVENNKLEEISENKSEIEITPNTEEEVNKIEIFEPPDDNYKTIVQVEPESKNTDSEEEKQRQQEEEEEQNKHSHNYLKEFLESQKGSRKPLQNFISKKFSNLSRKNSKDSTTNLIENQYHSLPDITASKNLRKCEKIDRKLRKCDKSCNQSKKNNNESRFIVNIGKHFDITANTNVPVDFELKIAKVPRKKSNIKKSKSKSEDNFLEAVKNLKDTLNNNHFDENHNIYKPEIIGIKAKAHICTSGDKEEQEITMDINDDCVKEYQEKLGTMRNYWGKMVNGNNQETDENDSKCKIVDVTTKVEDVKKKFEPPPIQPEKPNKVQATKQLFEKIDKSRKISPIIKETSNYFEVNSKNKYHNDSNQFESLNPNSVEIINKNESKQNGDNTHKSVTKSISSSDEYPEFDHVRYRVVKSDLFQKKIFANCEKESQFDGLMQYLQDYSFQELLYDNNIVIIEPIRSKVPHESTKTLKTKTRNITPLMHKNTTNGTNTNSLGMKRHFFYHPIRVNKEVNDDELPNPDTVKQVRQFFEGGLKRSQSSQEFQGPKQLLRKVDPDKDQCSASDSTANSTNISDFGSQDNIYAISNDHCCEQQYISEEILKKIREYGSTVTYYGGQVVKRQSGQPVLTKAIMEEIKNNEKRILECNCKKGKDEKEDGNKESYQGFKFKLIKSNSCSSRLELVGTTDLKAIARKYNRMNHNLKNVKELNETVENNKMLTNKNAINENIKKTMEENNNTQPKIIGEEKKVLTQWSDTSKEKTFNKINFNEKKITNYHNFENVTKAKKKIDDMEFEPYEVA